MHATRHDGNASTHDAESRARKQDAESSSQVMQVLQVSLVQTLTPQATSTPTRT